MIEFAPIQSSASPMMRYHEQPQDIGIHAELHYILPVGLLLHEATSVSSYSVEWPLDYVTATNAGLSDSLFTVKPASVQVALQEIKTTTGLTWQQLARIFNVAPRSLHLWMDGKSPDSIHEERLYRVLTMIRRLPFSEAFQNRTFLLSPQADGTILFDLLTAADDDAFIDYATRASKITLKGATSGVDERSPLPPSITMDAVQDTLHISLPGRRAVKAVKRKDSAG